MNRKVFTRFILWAACSLIAIWAVDCYAQSVHDVANAIARTEGYYVKGSKPNRYRNPGDIRRFHGAAYPGEVARDRFGYVRFKSAKAGWAALESNLQRIVDGSSSQYDQSMTFGEIAKIYAADPRWGKTFCKILRVTPAMTFQEYFGLAPRIRLTQGAHDATTLMRVLEVRNDMPELFAMSAVLASLR